MIRCPIIGMAVPTGLSTETVVFDTIDPKLEMPLRCPACLKIHKWKPKDAWIDNPNAPAVKREADD
jgi:hypothetical protein